MTLAAVVLVTFFASAGVAVKAVERHLDAHEARMAVVARMAAQMEGAA